VDRSLRRGIKKLPLSPYDWEVAVGEAPFDIEGYDEVRLFVVVEQHTGIIRVGGPLVPEASLLDQLAPAFVDPVQPCVPARPRRLLSTDGDLVGQLGPDLKAAGVRVERIDALTVAEESLASLGAHFEPVRAPGISAELLDAWRVALRNLADAAPWRVLPDGVLFGLEGLPDLADPVAVVLGYAGEQHGVVLYPSFDNYRDFVVAAHAGDMELLGEVETVNLYLDLADELEPEELEACHAAGLELSGGFYPRVVAMLQGEGVPAGEFAQAALLAAIEAIVAMTADHPERLLHAGDRRRVPTSLGLVEVVTTPEYEPALTNAEYAVGCGPLYRVDRDEEHVALVIKLRKRDARRLADTLIELGVDGLEVERHPGATLVFALAGNRRVGRLVEIEPGRAPTLVRGGSALLCVSAGGPRRQRVDSADFVLMHEVAVR